MKKILMLVVPIFLFVITAQAWEWFAWCTDGYTATPLCLVTTFPGTPCTLVDNPRGSCPGSINPIGCTGAGSAVTLSVITGNCGIEPIWSQPGCFGTTTTPPGVAAC
jgi:hypothetical protein